MAKVRGIGRYHKGNRRSAERQLSGIKGKMGKRSDLWRELETEFAALPDPSHALRADWQYTVGSGELGDWRVTGTTNLHLQVRFEAVARRAGATLFNGVPIDPLLCWLELLRRA